MISDVLHVLTACPTYSPAHTRAGIHDNDNRRVIAGIELIVQRMRPRIVTLENTNSLLHQRHFDYYRWAVTQLTKLGYSVETRILSLVEYNVP